MTVVDVDRLVDDLADVIHGVVRAVACAADGTPLSTSTGLSPATASRLAAVAVGIAGLTAGAAALLHAGRVSHMTIEMAGATTVLTTLVLTTLPDGTHLAVLTAIE